MKIITESIKECIEIALNKNIENVDKEELKNIKEINIARTSINGEILNLNYNELIYFENLKELTILNCPINEEFMKIIIEKKLEKLEFYNCDFVDECIDFFYLLNVKELILDNCQGINEASFSKINKLTLKNITLSNNIENINILDISHIKDIKEPVITKVKEIIILDKNIEKLKKINIDVEKIIIIDERNEEVGVYNND